MKDGKCVKEIYGCAELNIEGLCSKCDAERGYFYVETGSVNLETKCKLLKPVTTLTVPEGETNCKGSCIKCSQDGVRCEICYKSKISILGECIEVDDPDTELECLATFFNGKSECYFCRDNLSVPDKFMVNKCRSAASTISGCEYYGRTKFKCNSCSEGKYPTAPIITGDPERCAPLPQGIELIDSCDYHYMSKAEGAT